MAIWQMEQVPSEFTTSTLLAYFSTTVMALVLNEFWGQQQQQQQQNKHSSKQTTGATTITTQAMMRWRVVNSPTTATYTDSTTVSANGIPVVASTTMLQIIEAKDISSYRLERQPTQPCLSLMAFSIIFLVTFLCVALSSSLRSTSLLQSSARKMVQLTQASTEERSAMGQVGMVCPVRMAMQMQVSRLLQTEQTRRRQWSSPRQVATMLMMRQMMRVPQLTSRQMVSMGMSATRMASLSSWTRRVSLARWERSVKARQKTMSDLLAVRARDYSMLSIQRLSSRQQQQTANSATVLDLSHCICTDSSQFCKQLPCR